MNDPRRKAALWGCGVSGLTFLAFSSSLRNGFTDWDDPVAIIGNPMLRAPWPVFLRWAAAPWTSAPMPGHVDATYRPLDWLSLRLDLALWGPSPLGFHLGSVLWHCASAVVLFLLARRLIKSDGWAAFAALFFALHPLRVEAVSWAAQRREVLCGFFGLLSVYLYIGWARRPSAAARLASALAYALAVTAKPAALAVPGAFLALDPLLGRRPGVAEKWPWAAVGLAVAALGLETLASSPGAAVPLSSFGLLPRLSAAGFGFGFYLGKAAWPSGLSPLYERSSLLEPWSFLAWWLVAAAALWAAWKARGQTRTPLLALAAYAVLLLPVLGLVKVGRQTAADRYSYLPGAVLALAVAAGLRAAAKPAGRRTVVCVAAGAWLAGLSALTIRQQGFWRDSVALWSRAAAVDERGYFVRRKLAEALAEAGRAREAEVQAAASTALEVDAFERAAQKLLDRGQTQKAAEYHARALALLGK